MLKPTADMMYHYGLIVQSNLLGTLMVLPKLVGNIRDAMKAQEDFLNKKQADDFDPLGEE